MAKRIIGRALRAARKWIAYWRYYQVFRMFREYTMIPAMSYVRNLAVVDRYSTVPGAVVECGVWKGGMIAGIARVLGPERDYFLVDSFEGLPEAKAIDGEAALRWQANKASPKYYDNCKAAVCFAQEAMQLAGAKHCHTVKGFFEESLATLKFDQPISVLRLDADWYDSTMAVLRHLYPVVANGGLIILDDYYTWDGCSRALHDFLSQASLPERVQQYDNDVCFLIKKSADSNLTVQIKKDRWTRDPELALDMRGSG